MKGGLNKRGELEKSYKGSKSAKSIHRGSWEISFKKINKAAKNILFKIVYNHGLDICRYKQCEHRNKHCMVTVSHCQFTHICG